MRNLRKLLVLYFLCCGIALHVAGGIFLFVVIERGPRVALRDTQTALAAFAVEGVARARSIGEYLAKREAANLGLVATEDAGIGAARAIALDHKQGYGRTLRVGPGHPYERPSEVTGQVRPGDIVEIEAGDFRGDVALWRTDDLVIRAVGGSVHIDASGTPLVQDKAIWLVTGSNIRIEGIEFSGARSVDRNGAGIRAEGDRLHVISCFFHDNENGILANPVAGGRLLVEYSEFARNGHDDGQAHQIYVHAVEEFILRFNYLHDSRVGSAVKSRADVNRISFNRIVDAVAGSSNYSIDLSEGGRAFIVGNQIEQGPLSRNGVLIAFAAERARGELQELFVVHNTLVNDRPTGTFVVSHASGGMFVYNNLFIGRGRLVRGDAIIAGNVAARDTWLARNDETFGGMVGSQGNRVVETAGIRSRSRLDYRLKAASPARDAGALLDRDVDRELVPDSEYEHPMGSRARVYSGEPDAGALEYVE